MSKTWSENVEDGLRQIEEGRAHPSHLVAILQGALEAGAAQQSQFEQASRLDPELSPAHIEAARQAMATLLGVFQNLLASLNEPLDCQQHLERLQKASQNVRNVRQASEQFAQRGPTSNGLVNRILRHLDWCTQGKPVGAPTRQLLEALPDLEDQYAGIIEQIRDPQAQEQLSQCIAPVLDSLQAWSDNLASPPQNLRETLSEACGQFDRLLAEIMQAELSMGPTGLPIVNLVLMALEQGRPEPVASAARHCQDLLRFQLPDQPPVQAAAQELFGHLQDLRQACAEGHIDRVEARRDALIDVAEQVAAVAAIYSSQNEVLDYVSREGLAQQDAPDLPPLLASLYRLAADFLEQRIPASSLELGVGRLEQLVARIDGNLDRARNQPDEIEATQAVLERLDEAGQLLRTFVKTPGLGLLEELEQILLEANDFLPAVRAGKGRP